MSRTYSVTEITSRFADYLHIPEGVLAQAQARGTAVHLACTNYAKGAWSPLDEEYRGYFQSFKGWFDRYVAEVVSVEEEYRDEAMGIVGHPDLVLVFVGDELPSVVDLKTPLAHQRLWRLQLASYKHLVLPVHQVNRTLSLRLDPQGGVPKANEYTGNHNEDFAAMVSALNAVRWLDAA